MAVVATALTGVALALAGCTSSTQGGGHEDEPLYRQYCAECHAEKGTGVPGALLNDPGVLAEGGDAALFKAIDEGVGVMPAFGESHEGPLSDDEIARIVEYLLSPDGLASRTWPGRRVYIENCSQCHGSKGMRIPAAPLNRTFLAERDDAVLAAVITRGYKTMPALGQDFGGELSNEEVGAVIGYLRMITGGAASVDEGASSDGPGSDAGDETTARGASIFDEQCTMCHGETGDAVPGLALLSAEYVGSRDDGALTTVIANGQGGMPGMSTAAEGPLSDEDIAAVVAYLRAQGGGAATPGDSDTSAGATLFQDQCTMCHGQGGDEVPGVALMGEDYLSANDDATLTSAITDGKGGMPGMGTAAGGSLSDEEVAAIVAYLRSGGGAPEATATPKVDLDKALQPAPAEAVQLFNDNCAACHAGRQLPTIDPTLVQKIINDGIVEKGMPGFRDKLTSDQIEGLARVIASGAPLGDGGNDNPFSGVVQHVDGWILSHPPFVKENGSQLCQQCHQLSFCSSCHTGGAVQ